MSFVVFLANQRRLHNNVKVRMLDLSHIAVVTVRDAFLNNEQAILANLSNAVGYSVNALRSVVISDDAEEEANRNKRQAVNSGGASMQIYVYGLIERVPVAVERLASDINNNVIAAVIIAGTVSLEHYLESRDTCELPGRDTGLLVSTIILSILLFILILAIIVWYCLNRRRARNYQEFSDENSLASRSDSIGQPPKVDTLPRLDIEELKRSERRLQEMLEAPIEKVTVEPTTSRNAPVEAILNMSPADPGVPIVIQSIDKLKDAADNSDDEDEFGEKKRKKSVVTFNENVEKFIHVEDSPDRASPDLEVYKL